MMENAKSLLESSSKDVDAAKKCLLEAEKRWGSIEIDNDNDNAKQGKKVDKRYKAQCQTCNETRWVPPRLSYTCLNKNCSRKKAGKPPGIGINKQRNKRKKTYNNNWRWVLDSNGDYISEDGNDEEEAN